MTPSAMTQPEAGVANSQCESKARAGVHGNDGEVREYASAQSQPVVGTFADRNRSQRIVPVRNRVDREVTCEPGSGRQQGMRWYEARNRAADNGMCAQDHRDGLFAIVVSSSAAAR